MGQAFGGRLGPGDCRCGVTSASRGSAGDGGTLRHQPGGIAQPVHCGLGDSPTISATLTDTGSALPVGGETLRVEQATSDSGPWSLTDLVTTDVTTGVGTYDVLPTGTTYYRFVFVGTDSYAAATSNVLTVLGHAVRHHPDRVAHHEHREHRRQRDDQRDADGHRQRIAGRRSNGASGAGDEQQRTVDAGRLRGPTRAGAASTASSSIRRRRRTTASFTPPTLSTPTWGPRATSSPSLSGLVPTSLTASPGETTVTVGGNATLTAVLTDTDASLPVGGQTVRVEQATSNSGPWSLVQTVTNDGTTGSYSLGSRAAADDVLPLRLRSYGHLRRVDEPRPHRHDQARAHQLDRITRGDHGHHRRRPDA